MLIMMIITMTMMMIKTWTGLVLIMMTMMIMLMVIKTWTGLVLIMMVITMTMMMIKTWTGLPPGSTMTGVCGGTITDSRTLVQS